MSKIKLENYDDYDYDQDFAYDYDQEYDDYEAFKQVQEEEPEVEVKVDGPIERPRKPSNEYYEKLREQINKEVEEVDDRRSFTSKKSTNYDSDTSIFGSLFNIVIWACVAVAVVLFIYFIITRQITTAFLYVLGLVVAFFIGYGLMYVFDTLIIGRD